MNKPSDSAHTISRESVENEVFDVLIVGGGIVGAGVARDAAMRGLRTLLIEQYDFAYGTSSRSSRLLHGGIRYLAQARIGLVREASVEKRILHRIAPHLAEAYPFIFPAKWFGRWPLWQLRIGVKIYDWLCGGQNLGRSSYLDKNTVLNQLPGFDPGRLSGAVRYYDGQTQDARLVIDTLRSAEAHGADVFNYTRVEGCERAGGSAPWRCRLRDNQIDREVVVQARTIVNAAGPWADQFEHCALNLRLTKGVHLVVDRERLRVPEAVVMTAGNRILFALPWGERTILGTTDTDYGGLIEDVKTEPEDVEYILRITNGYFPEARLTPDDIISDWAGLRPLIWSGRGRPSDISRSHEIRSPQPGWYDVAGGKLTTYRLMAEQTVDRVEKWLGRPHTQSRTAREPLLPPEETNPVSRIVPPPVERGIVEHCCRHEWARHSEDIMIRRTSWHYYHRDREAIEQQVKQWMLEID